MAPALDEFIAKLRESESGIVRREVESQHLKLYPDDTIQIEEGGVRAPVSNEALTDLGRLVRIPSDYFLETCEPELRAYSFNYLLKNTGSEHPTVSVEIESGTVSRIYPTSLIPAPRLGILESVRKSLPADLDPSRVKFITHRWNGTFDVCVVSETRTCEPQVGDVVAFGVSVAEDLNGAVQVQAASYRLSCKNGAVNRICDNNQYRLRRPMSHTNRHDDYLRRVKALCDEAWRKWTENADNIKSLVVVPIYEERLQELKATLRNAPFFLSAAMVNRAIARMRVEVSWRRGEPTAWDLWNALTYIGSHEESSVMMSYRLRRAAGELAHHSARTCATCRQIILSN
jgi:hypothetical protein